MKTLKQIFTHSLTILLVSFVLAGCCYSHAIHAGEISRGEQKELEFVQKLIQQKENINKYDCRFTRLFGRKTTLLHNAARNGYLEVTKELFKHEADVNLQNEEGKTPLHYAAEEGSLDVTKELLKCGADVNLQDSGGETPLHYAVSGSVHEQRGNYRKQRSGNYPKIVKELLKHGADFNLQNKSGNTPLSYAVQGNDKLLETIIAIVKELIEHKANVNLQDETGNTPLHYAAKKGYLDVTKELLKHGANISITNKKGQTLFDFLVSVGSINQNIAVELVNHGYKIKSLSDAVMIGDLNEVKAFIQKKSNVNENDYKGIEFTPLYIAVKNGNTEIVKELLQHGANAGLTPLEFASRMGHLEIVKELLEHGAKVNEDRSPTPLYFASQMGHLEIVKELLEHGAKVNGNHSNTPLHAAAFSGHLEVVKELLAHGADVSMENRNGTPFDEACSRSRDSDFNLQVVEELAKHGTPSEKAFSAKVIAHHNLREACKKGDLNKVKELINHGVDINGGRSFDFPLIVAIKEKHNDVAKELLKRGAKVNVSEGQWFIRYQRFMTPLHVAAACGNIEMVKELIKHGTNVNILSPEDRNERTPLWDAAANGHLDVVKELIKSGANVNDEYPLEAAIYHGHLDVVKELIKSGTNVNYTLPLKTAVSEGYSDIAMELLRKGAYDKKCLFMAVKNNDIQIVKELLSKSKENINDGTLIWAAANNYLDIVKEFILHGANLNVKYDSGKTPFFAALEYDNINVINELLKAGADVDVNMQTKEGETLLHLAVRKNNTETIKKLIQAGANMEAKNLLFYHHVEAGSNYRSKKRDSSTPSMTPLQLAAIDKNVKAETLKCLLDLGANPNTACTILDTKAIAINEKLAGYNQKISDAILRHAGANYDYEIQYQVPTTTYQKEYKEVSIIDIVDSAEKKALIEAAMKKR